MYAVVKTGGKQYRVEEGQALLVERLPAEEGETVSLEPLLFVDGSDVVEGDGLAAVTVEARVISRERGPKLRVVKFKPKRGYKRRTGHRQELTRIEVTSVARSSASQGSQSASGEADSGPARTPDPVAADKPAPEAPTTETHTTEAENGA